MEYIKIILSKGIDVLGNWKKEALQKWLFGFAIRNLTFEFWEISYYIIYNNIDIDDIETLENTYFTGYYSQIEFETDDNFRNKTLKQIAENNGNQDILNTIMELTRYQKK
jgi:hypothetical protein